MEDPEARCFINLPVDSDRSRHPLRRRLGRRPGECSTSSGLGGGENERDLAIAASAGCFAWRHQTVFYTEETREPTWLVSPRVPSRGRRGRLTLSGPAAITACFGDFVAEVLAQPDLRCQLLDVCDLGFDLVPLARGLWVELDATGDLHASAIDPVLDTVGRQPILAASAA